MKFSKDGKFINKWGHSSLRYGKEGSFGMGFFNLPHDITLDEQKQHVYVADRENGRVQVFFKIEKISYLFFLRYLMSKVIQFIQYKIRVYIKPFIQHIFLMVII